MYGTSSNDFSSTKFKQVFGPHPKHHRESIKTTRNGVKLSLESNETLNNETSSNLAGRGIGNFALRAVSFGTLGTKTFSEKDLTKFEKEAYRFTGQHALNEKKNENAEIYKTRLNLRQELSKATKENNIEKISSINSELENTNYKKGFIKYETYAATDNEKITNEMKLFTGRATSENIKVGDVEAVRITDVYNFERKGYNPILSLLAEVETQQEQGFNATRTAVAGLSWLSNLGDKYTGGASSYNVDIILSKDGRELDKTELEKYRQENAYGESDPTFQDRMMGLGRLAQDTSGLLLAGGAAYAMKNKGFAKNATKLGKAGIIGGLILAPLLAGAVYESTIGDFNSSINLINYDQQSVSSFFSSSFTNINNELNNAGQNINNTFSSAVEFIPNLLKRASKIPVEANKLFKKQGLNDQQASLAARATLLTGAALTVGGGAAVIYAANKAVKNKELVNSLISSKSLKKAGLIGGLVIGATVIASTFLGSKAEAATIPKDKIQIIDADTFKIKGQSDKVRLYDVDAPETSVYSKYNAKTPQERAEAKQKYLESFKNGEKNPSKTAFIDQDFGIEAKEAASKFFKESKNISVVKKGEDKYGRDLSVVTNGKGQDLSEYLVEQGLAITELPSSKLNNGSLKSHRMYESMVRAYQHEKGIFSKDDFVDPSDFRKGKLSSFKKRLDTEIKLHELKERGLGNNEYAYILADEDTYFTLSASLGASAHYGASLESNLMKQAGYNNMSSVKPYKGLAESLIEYNNEMLGNKPLGSFERFVARSYDSGLSAGGIGNWLNREIFMPRGWGRVYKDEKGALPSIAGILGKILDESYLYYANINPDWTLLGQDYKSGRGYNALEDKQGIFQTMFEDTTAFGLSMAQSLGMYIAIIQPLEMISAGINKSFIDSSIEGTIINNTPGAKRNLNRARNFADVFMAEFYFGDLANEATKPGGMLGAVLRQKMQSEAKENRAFFDHEGGQGSAFKAQMLISRGRAQRIMEGTFKPFLIDIVNPFNPSAVGSYIVKDPLSATGTKYINSYDKFNRAVNRLISVIAAPVGLQINFKRGEAVDFRGINVELTDITDDIKLADAKANKGGVHIIESDVVHRPKTYTNLATQYNHYDKKITDHLIQNNEDLYKILINEGGMSENAAKQFIFRGGDKSEIINTIPSVHRTKVQVLLERKDQLNAARSRLGDQFNTYADKIEVSTTNTGTKYKTNIASALQDILEMTPLNPLKWGLFSSSAEHADEFVRLSQTFSFRDAAEYTEQMITGQTKIGAIFTQFEPVIPEAFKDGVKLKVEEVLSNKMQARMVSFDNIIGEVWKNIKSIWKPEPKIGPNIEKLTKELRQVEITVAKAAEKAKVEGFKFVQIQDSIDASKRSAQVVLNNVDGAEDLLDSVIEYSHATRSNGRKTIDIGELGKAIESAEFADVTGKIMRQTNMLSGNIKIEKFLEGSKGPIAAAIFLGLALNNMMQSTKGASIITQLGMALYGENEDIAIKYEANRILPTEAIAVSLGLDQTAVNLAADTVAISSTYALGYSIAKKMKTSGYMTHTFDIETVHKMALNEQITITDRNLKQVDKDYINKMGAGHDSFIYVNKKTYVNGEEVIKQTVLTRTTEGFRSEKLLQEFAENVPTKAFIFASIGLLATNAIREGAANMLAAMSESPDDKNYLAILGGLTLGGFAIGAALDKTYIAKPLEQSTEIVKAAGQVSSKRMLQHMFTTKAGKWAVGGAIIGGTIWAAKLVLDPNVTQKGSLDPLIGGVALGLGVGVFKRSASLGLAAGLVAMSAMAAINWAGIRVFELGRSGKELDPESTKLVAQLSQFSTAVLEKEKDNTAFTVGIAAYASQFAGTRSLLSGELNSVATETQVIAKQSPLPVLQFFVAEKIEGKRGEIYERSGPDSEYTVRKYTLGIQSGALLGTSISVELPISYTPGSGFFGFSYNDDNNLMSVPNFAIKVGVWAALATSSIGLTYNLGGWLSTQGYNLTGNQMFKTNAANFAKGADDLFSASKFMFSAAEKITSFFIRTTVGTFATLQGTDASMAFEAYKNSMSKVAQAEDMMNNMSVKDLSSMSLEDTQKINSLDDITNAKDVWKGIKEGKILNHVGRSKHLAIGAIVGAVVGGLANDLVKHHRLRSSMDANESYEVLQQIEAQEERRKMIYVAIGGSAGGILNDVRGSTGLIKSLHRHYSTAVTEYAKSKNLPLDKIQTSIVNTMTKMSENPNVNKYKSLILNNKIGKLAKGVFNFFGKNKMVGVFLAATAFNFVRTKSDFGIASMMDKHIVYDEKGNAYKDYDLQTAYNLTSHLGVSAALGIHYTAIIGLTASPQLNQRATILEFSKRELASLDPIPTANVLSKIKSKAGDVLFFGHRYRTEKESVGLLKSLLSIDNEFEEFEKWQAGQVENPNLKMPRKLEKLESVLRLRQALGKEELKEFIRLQNQKQQGIKFDFEEDQTYRKFLENINNNLGKQASNFTDLGKGFKVTNNLGSFSRRATMVLAASFLAKTIITTVGNQGGEIGKDSYLDRIYNKANQVGKIGQRRQDGTTVGLEGFISIGADYLRVITGRDVIDVNRAVDQLNGKMIKSTGQRLVSNAKNMQEIQRNVKDLSEMLVLDNPNAYIATLNFGGKTLRNGDKGTTTSSYFQLQGPGQDISTATYSMTAKFIFSQYTAGRGRLGKIIDSGLANFKKGDKASYNLAAVNIRNATSMLDALKSSRTYSKNNADIAATLAGDSIAAGILAARQEALVHIGSQPVDSLYANTFFETIEKAKHRTDKEGFTRFLKGIARSDRKALDVFADLMEQGMFQNFYTRSAITNVIFFTGSAGKPPKKGNAQYMATEMSDIWHQTQDLSVQAEMFEQSRIEIFDHFMDKIAMPMSSHSIFAVMPNWMKIGGLSLTTVILSAYITNSIAQYTETKTRFQSNSELYDVFGRTQKVAGVKIELLPNDTQKIINQITKSLTEGSKYKWTKQLEGDSGLFVGTSGTESRFIGMLNIGQDGKPKHIRFEINPHLNDLMTPAGPSPDFLNVLQTINTKGEQLRNLFIYTQDALDETGKSLGKASTSVAKELLEVENISIWMRSNSTGKNVENVYEIFNTSNTAVTKTQFIGAAVENFQSKFESGLDNLFDLRDISNIDNHLLSIVNVNGQEVFVAELLDPDFKLPGVTEGEFGPATDLETRKQAIIQNHKAWKTRFQDEIRTIVEEEYSKIGWKGKGSSIVDDAVLIAEANRKALITIKTKMADPSTALGAVTRGAGIIQPTDMIDQKVTVDNAQKANKKRHTIKTTAGANGNPVDTFIDEFGETLQYSRPLGNVGFWDGLAAGGKGLWVAGTSLFDALTGADVLGAYLRVAEIQGNPFATDLDKSMANKELGRAILSSAIGFGIGAIGGKLLKGLGSEKAKALMSPKNIGKGALGLIAGGVLTSALWKDVISPGLSKLGKATEKSNVLGKAKEVFDGAWFKTGDVVGQIAAFPVIGAYNMGKHFGVEKEAAFFTGGLLGGSAMTAMILFGAGIVGTAISLPVLAAVSLGVGLVIGVAAIFGGKQMTSGMTYATREIMKIPVIGTAVGMTDPYRAIRNQERFKHHFQDSPFLLGYVGDIVNSNWLQYLAAAENPGGRDTASLLFGEVLSQGEGTAINISAWKLQAAESLIGAPKPIIDEVINNELRIRAEAYSDFIIGRYTWDQLVDNSDNSNAIRSMEAAKRADKVRIIEQARSKAIKSAMDAGGPSQALKIGNPRKGALTQQQVAKVEQVYADLNTYGKPTTQVTQATVVTHKSNAVNSLLELNDKTKKQALGGNVPSPTKNHVYKGTISSKKGSATIGFTKEADPMNPILIKEAQTNGSNNPQPINLTQQNHVFNLFKNQ